MIAREDIAEIAIRNGMFDNPEITPSEAVYSEEAMRLIEEYTL